MTHIIYVYGTLRPGTGPTVQIPGVMYDLGWFPGVKLSEEDNPNFLAERIEVTDERLADLDHYEGYDPKRPDTSLYIRRPYLDGWIYEYNSSVSGRPVLESGDWLDYTNSSKGRNSEICT